MLSATLVHVAHALFYSTPRRAGVMGSYGAHIPRTYEEEMEQIRIAMEISSANLPVHLPAPPRRRPERVAQVPVRPLPTREPAAQTLPPRHVGRRIEQELQDVQVASNGNERYALALRLRQRHGISKWDAEAVVNMLDGDAKRANDVCAIMKVTNTAPSRALAWLRNVGWDVELAIERVTESVGASTDAESERVALRRRAAAAQNANVGDARTVKQNLDSDKYGEGSVPSRFERAAIMNAGSASFARAPLGGRDMEADRYQRDRWEHEMRTRNAEAKRVTRDETNAKTDSAPQSSASRASSARPQASPPRPSRTPNASLPSIELLATKSLIEILELFGFAPSSSALASVRSAYKKAALRFHPDRLVGEEDESAKMYKIEVWKLLGAKLEAYRV